MEVAAPTVARQVPIVCPGHQRPVCELHYSPETPDGVFLISACHDKLPMLRHGSTGDWIGTFSGHKGAVWSAKLDPEGLLAATGAADFTARVWDAITGKELQAFEHKHIVKSVEFSADRSCLATGGHEGLLRVFDLSTLQQTAEIPHSDKKLMLNKVLWGVAASTVLTGASDGSVHVWDLRTATKSRSFVCSTGSVEHTSETDHVKRLGGAPRTSHVQDMELKSDGAGDVLTVASGACVSIFDGRTFELKHAHAMPMNFLHEGGASLHPDRSKFVAGGSDVEVRVFDATTGKELECHKGHHGPVRCVRYAPDGKSYATGSEDATIRLWSS